MTLFIAPNMLWHLRSGYSGHFTCADTSSPHGSEIGNGVLLTHSSPDEAGSRDLCPQELVVRGS